MSIEIKEYEGFKPDTTPKKPVDTKKGTTKKDTPKK